MSMCFFRKRRERKRREAAEKALMNQMAAGQEAAINEAKPTPNPQPIQQNEMVKPIEPQAPVKEPVEPIAKEDVIKEQPVKPKEEKVVEDKSKKPQKYHVSQNKDEDSENFKKWRVRKEGSTKTIKFFDTQKEAIEFAEELAEKAGSSVVIHKVDGSIRKQDYSKKE